MYPLDIGTRKLSDNFNKRYFYCIIGIIFIIYIQFILMLIISHLY